MWVWSKNNFVGTIEEDMDNSSTNTPPHLTMIKILCRGGCVALAGCVALRCVAVEGGGVAEKLYLLPGEIFRREEIGV